MLPDRKFPVVVNWILNSEFPGRRVLLGLRLKKECIVNENSYGNFSPSVTEDKPVAFEDFEGARL